MRPSLTVASPASASIRISPQTPFSETTPDRRRVRVWRGGATRSVARKQISMPDIRYVLSRQGRPFARVGYFTFKDRTPVEPIDGTGLPRGHIGASQGRHDIGSI